MCEVPIELAGYTGITQVNLYSTLVVVAMIGVSVNRIKKGTWDYIKICNLWSRLVSAIKENCVMDVD